jgi:hypothetical protein
VEQIAEIWNRNGEIISNLIWDKLVEIDFKVSEDGNYLCKCANDIQIAFYPNWSRNVCTIFCGFFNENEFKSSAGKLKTELPNLLNRKLSEKYFSREEDWGKQWLIKKFLIGECDKNIVEIINEVVEALDSMAEEIKKI